ncbi:MAG: DUF547 domain-containing protein [Dokdonella sp.]
MRWLIAILFALLTTQVSAQEKFDLDHAQWNSLLAAHVSWTRDGTASVADYAGFAQDRDALKAYLASASKVSSSTYDGWNKSDRQAFLINVYNAATVELILTRYPDLKSIKDLGSLFRSPWQKDVINLLGEQRSLDDIEHTMLRGAPDYSEPRIHFAVNCASIGCPALRPEAFVGSRLPAQLEDQTTRFLRDRTRNRYEADKGLRVSKIFDWYSEDFDKHAGSVPKFLASYAEALGLYGDAKGKLESGSLRISYSDYDWRLNDN